jgi:membrane-bound lytic murein transglycosylase A
LFFRIVLILYSLIYQPTAIWRAIGRVLAERKLIPRQEISTERIKRWMQANPEQAKEVRGTNRSLVFFRITGLDMEDEPAGAQGVPLSPGRSIAVDPQAHVYGTPFFIEGELPIANGRADARFPRLMVAQDSGSAIVGPARADIYLGAGDAAGRIAGLIRQQGRFAMLLPRELDMVAAGKAMPLPQPKPPTMVAQKGKEGQAQVLPRDVAEPQEEKTTWVNGALIARAQKWKTTSKRLSSFLSKRQPTGKGAPARS